MVRDSVPCCQIVIACDSTPARAVPEKVVDGDTLDVRIVSIDPAVARKADAGVGYLFEHADAAAELGRAHGADWILVGRLHKPSFLFSYLMARLVDTRAGKVAEDLIVEVKGQQHIVMRKGIERLAEKLSVRLKATADDAGHR